ncbi:MAG: esterase-like activity of phytase family protein [Paracoccaceae bacterium]
MTRLLTTAAALALVVGGAAAQAEKVTATLRGHAQIPAATFVLPPADAPRALAVSGRFTGPGNTRTEELYAIEGRTWIGPADGPKRATGLSLPFVGQPVQGFSGVQSLGEGRYLALSDNGFGSKANSPDAMLMAHVIRPDWETGRVAIEETIFLSDPDRVLPFPIQNENTEARYLTGADFDIESVQRVHDRIWFGDEFGPYLFATDRDGRVVFVTETRLGDRTLRSPDHPGLRLPNLPGAVSFEVRRSRGFEGMAQSVDGTKLYPLIEGPIWDAAAGATEIDADGNAYLRMLEFDIDANAWTGNAWRYTLEDPGHAIGDFNMITETRGLVIERDGGEGDPADACPEGAPGLDCFFRPAEFKRVYLIEMREPGTAVEKLAYVDLMDIEDPDGIARIGGADGRFTFPFVTVESVDRVDERHILVGNDNNLPFSTGRQIGAPDANEWILLEVGDMLK